MGLTTKNSKADPDIDSLLSTSGLEEFRPYIRLWAAVFAKGLRDYCDEVAKGKHSKAHSWFHSHLNEPGSFIWLCGVFKWDPVTARLRVSARVDSISKMGDLFKVKKSEEREEE